MESEQPTAKTERRATSANLRQGNMRIGIGYIRIPP